MKLPSWPSGVWRRQSQGKQLLVVCVCVCIDTTLTQLRRLEYLWCVHMWVVQCMGGIHLAARHTTGASSHAEYSTWILTSQGSEAFSSTWPRHSCLQTGGHHLWVVASCDDSRCTFSAISIGEQCHVYNALIYVVYIIGRFAFVGLYHEVAFVLYQEYYLAHIHRPARLTAWFRHCK